MKYIKFSLIIITFLLPSLELSTQNIYEIRKYTFNKLSQNQQREIVEIASKKVRELDISRLSSFRMKKVLEHYL